MPKKPTHTISEVPNLMNDWDWEKNEGLSPYILGAGSPKKVWWKCFVCSNEWQATPNSRTGVQQCGCPKCGKEKAKETRRNNITKNGGSLACLFPLISSEWNWEDVTGTGH